jgi:hypothetical protein
MLLCNNVNVRVMSQVYVAWMLVNNDDVQFRP